MTTATSATVAPAAFVQPSTTPICFLNNKRRIVSTMRKLVVEPNSIVTLEVGEGVRNEHLQWIHQAFTEQHPTCLLLFVPKGTAAESVDPDVLVSRVRAAREATSVAAGTSSEESQAPAAPAKKRRFFGKR